MKFSLSAAKKAGLYILPYLLFSAALVFMIIFAVDETVDGSIYYRLITNAPALSQESGDFVAPPTKTDAEEQALKKNNEGDAFTVVADFPPISLGQQWATLTIESIGLTDAPVLHGDYDEVLWHGVGHNSNSRFPGQGGKVVLASHVAIADFGFTKLETMTGGESVKLSTIYGDYEYKVRETVIFDENDPSLLMPEEKDSGDVLICYTCYPYVTTSIRTQRFAIVCDRVSGKDWTKGAAQ